MVNHYPMYNSVPLSPDLLTLKRLFTIVDRLGMKAEPKQRVILFGTGALYGWGTGRRYCQKLRDAIQEEAVRCLGQAWIVDTHWLGYPRMDAPFVAQATLSSIELGALGVQQAVGHFPEATFDFVCFSMSGLITLYWSLLPDSAHVLERVNSIVTVNSPLTSYSQFEEACRLYLAEYHTLFGQPGVPGAISELRDGSLVTQRVAKWDLPIRLLNVVTKDDPIVPPTIARLQTGKDYHQYYEFTSATPAARKPLNKHHDALDSEAVHSRIVEMICGDHLVLPVNPQDTA